MSNVQYLMQITQAATFFANFLKPDPIFLPLTLLRIIGVHYGPGRESPELPRSIIGTKYR
jgi:hypothetical protein